LKIRFLQMCLSLLCATTPLLHADTPSDPLLFARGEGDYPPYEMVIDAQLTGLHIDLIREVTGKIGRQAHFVTLPWKRCLQYMEKGKVDALSYMYKTPEREAYTHYLEGNILSSSKIGFIINEDRKDEIRFNGNLQDLAPYSFGLERGFNYGVRFEQADLPYKMKFDSIEEITNQLILRRLDIGLYFNDVYHYRRLNDGHFKKILFLKPLLFEQASYLGFSRSKSEGRLAQQFAEVMTTFKHSAEYLAILRKYGLQ